MWGSGEVCRPANSPDLHPADFYFWVRVKSELRKLPNPPENCAELKPMLKAAIAAIPPQEIKAACLSFKKRLAECIANEGRPFEQKRKRAEDAKRERAPRRSVLLIRVIGQNV